MNKNCMFQLPVSSKPGPNRNSAAHIRKQENTPAKSFMSFNYKFS